MSLNNVEKIVNVVTRIWNNPIFSNIRFTFMAGLLLIIISITFIYSIPLGIVTIITCGYWIYKIYRVGYKKGATTIIGLINKNVNVFRSIKRDSN